MFAHHTSCECCLQGGYLDSPSRVVHRTTLIWSVGYFKPSPSHPSDGGNSIWPVHGVCVVILLLERTDRIGRVGTKFITTWRALNRSMNGERDNSRWSWDPTLCSATSKARGYWTSLLRLLFVEGVLKHPFLVFQHPFLLSKHPIFFCWAPTSFLFRFFFRRLCKAPAKTVGLGICGFGREIEIHRTNGEGKIRCYFLRGSDRHSLAASRRVLQVRVRGKTSSVPFIAVDQKLNPAHQIWEYVHI